MESSNANRRRINGWPRRAGGDWPNSFIVASPLRLLDHPAFEVLEASLPFGSDIHGNQTDIYSTFQRVATVLCRLPVTCSLPSLPFSILLSSRDNLSSPTPSTMLRSGSHQASRAVKTLAQPRRSFTTSNSRAVSSTTRRHVQATASKAATASPTAIPAPYVGPRPSSIPREGDSVPHTRKNVNFNANMPMVSQRCSRKAQSLVSGFSVTTTSGESRLRNGRVVRVPPLQAPRRKRN